MRTRTITTAAALGLVLAATLTGCQAAQNAAHDAGAAVPTSSSAPHTIKADFVRVVDGDTIIVKPTSALPATNDEGTEHSVRVLGIDAPEMNKMKSVPPECGAQAATDNLHDLLAGHSFVTLVFDAQSDRTDRYGRSLAYVELPGNTSLSDVGQDQVQSGFAEAWFPSYAHAPTRYRVYADEEQTAKERKVGSWVTCGTLGR